MGNNVEGMAAKAAAMGDQKAILVTAELTPEITKKVISVK